MATQRPKTAKPTVFFSHSSRDAAALKRLKQAFVDKTGASVDIFLSSDGQSIPLGANWVHRVEEGLDGSDLMFVFVSPSSLRSHWLFFEAGYAYSRGLRVIPVGINGVDLTTLNPPLSLLQGRNLNSKDGLNNLIAEINKVFERQHPETFTDEEFADIFGKGNIKETAPGHLGLVANITFVTPYMQRTTLSHLDDRSAAHRLYAKAAEVLARAQVEHALTQFGDGIFYGLEAYGVSIRMMQKERKMTASIDTIAIEPGLDLCTRLMTEMPDLDGLNGCQIAFDFKRGVTHLAGPEKISARVDRERFALVSANTFKIADMQIGLGYRNEGTPASQVCFTLDGKAPELAVMRETIDYLFEKEILRFHPMASPAVKRDDALD